MKIIKVLLTSLTISIMILLITSIFTSNSPTQTAETVLDRFNNLTSASQTNLQLIRENPKNMFAVGWGTIGILVETVINVVLLMGAIIIALMSLFVVLPLTMLASQTVWERLLWLIITAVLYINNITLIVLLYDKLIAKK